MKITGSSLCEKGKVREINQDAVFSFCTDQWGIFAVADGMGGYEEGERASREVVKALQKWTEQAHQVNQLKAQMIILQLKQALDVANEKIMSETPEGMKCGCTVVVMMLIRHECILITLGDSRCYELKGSFFNKQLVQLTVDEIVGGSGPQRNRLTNALGVWKPMACRVQIMPFHGICTYLMCTDGIYKYCNDSMILSIIKKTNWNNTCEILQELQQHVEKNGAGDNYSALLIRAQN